MNEPFLDQFLFMALPYICLFTFLLMTVHRYRAQSFSYSSLSSQFLENDHHFWAVVPFHYGILAITVGHFLAFLVPRSILAWNSHPLRLYILEVSALAFGILTLVGIVGVMIRRFSNSKVRKVTTPTDWILFAMLLLQAASGIGVALFVPWGLQLVRLQPLSLPVVDLQAQSGHHLRLGNAASGQIPHRTGVPHDRVLPLHPTRTRTRHSQPLPVAQAASGAVVRPQGQEVIRKGLFPRTRSES